MSPTIPDHAWSLLAYGVKMGGSSRLWRRRSSSVDYGDLAAIGSLEQVVAGSRRYSPGEGENAYLQT